MSQTRELKLCFEWEDAERAHRRKNLHSPLRGRSLGAGQCSFSSWSHLLKLVHLTVYGICEEDSASVSNVEEDVLQRRASLLHYQSEGQGMMAAFSWGRLWRCAAGCAARCAQGCPSEQGPVPQGLCTGARTLLLARISTQPAWGALKSSSSWRKKQTLAGKNPSALERVLHGSGLLRPPDHPQDIPTALLKQ